MSSLMFYCLKVLISAIYEKWVTDQWTDKPTDGPTDGWTDGRTDIDSYRDAWTHLKRKQVRSNKDGRGKGRR